MSFTSCNRSIMMMLSRSLAAIAGLSSNWANVAKSMVSDPNNEMFFFKITALMCKRYLILKINYKSIVKAMREIIIIIFFFPRTYI